MSPFKIPHVEFVASAPTVQQAPKRPLPEIAFAGRSNVGKSSLINSLVNHKGLALTSSTPGKTRLLNYFVVDRGLCYFVDLPGYGFARVPGELKKGWGETIEGYLRDSTRLKLVVLILDIRHGLTAIDQSMIDGLHTLQRPWLAVLTKADKLGTGARIQAVNKMLGILTSQGARGVIPYSSLDHFGRDELWAAVTGVLAG